MRNHILLLFVVMLIGFPPMTSLWGTNDIDSTLSVCESQVRQGPGSEIFDAIHHMTGSRGHFTENLGQIDNEDIRFYANGNPLSVGLTPRGVELSLRKPMVEGNSFPSISPDVETCSVIVSISFEGYNRVEPHGVAPFGHTSNFFLGDDPDRWARNVKNYGEVMYEDIYDGIDLRFYFKDGMFKYDFIVGKGVDPTIIQLRYDGVKDLTTDLSTGDLLIHTSAGTIRDMRPVILQDLPGVGNQVYGTFQLHDDCSIGFGIPEGISKDWPMVIDPGLQFSTYLGGSENDFGTAIAYDDDGNIYVAGYTDSLDFPVTPSALYPEFIGGSEDVFIAKLDTTGSSLLFATYVGGLDDERPNAMEVLPGDGLCVVGYTESTDFPTAGNALNNTFLGTEDGFILKLSLDGSVLHYSSYLGGNRKDHARAIDVGDDGSVYVFGLTFSPDLPTTPGVYQRSHAGVADVFAYKLNSSLEDIVYCTYIGGTNNDGFMGAHVNDDGTSYLVGYTRSDDFPLISGAYCSTRGVSNDGFVAVLSSTGEDLLHSTLLAGDGLLNAHSVAVDTNGLVYVTGDTNATDFPVTPDAIKSTVSGTRDIFLTVFDDALSKLEYSTLVGGSELDYEPKLIYAGGQDIIYLSGRTTSNDLETTSDAFDPLYRGESDSFIAGFNTTTYKVQYLTYFGGDEDDHPMDIRSDDEGNLYLAGYTRSTDFPTTRGVYCQTFDPGQYLIAYVSKLAPGPGTKPPGAPHGLRTEVGMDSIILFWEPTNADGCRVFRYNIYRGTTAGEEVLLDNVTGTASLYYDDHVYSGIRYYYRISAESTAGEGPLCTPVTARILGPPTEVLNLTLSTGNGTVTMQWEPPMGPGGDLLRYKVHRGETRPNLVIIGSSLEEPLYVDTNVELGTFYYYAVMAYSEHGDGPLSEAIRIKPLDTPSQPREFKVTPGDGKVSLSWNLPASDGGTMIMGFHIWRGTDPSDVNISATLNPAQLNYVDADVVNGRTYLYFVTAFSDLGESRPTNAIDVTPFGLPGRVMDLQATADDGRVSMVWSPPETDGGRKITKYKVYAGEGSAGAMVFLTQIGNVTTFDHTGLTNGVTYFYQVTAVNEAGEGQVSETVSARPMGLPGPVRDLMAEAVKGGIRLTWKLPDDLGGADTVKVWVYRGDPDEPQLEDVLTGAVEFLDTNVTPGDTYEYWARTETSFGRGPLVGPVEVTAVTVPGAVRDLETAYDDGKVHLTWTAPEYDGGSAVIMYTVKRGIFVTGLVEVGRVSTLNYTDLGLDNGKEYLYVVVAVNAIGPGPQSDVVEGTPLGPPGAPGLFKAKVEGKKVVLSWAAPTGSDIAPVTGYVILRAVGDGEFEVLAQVSETSYTDEDVKTGQNYRYTVKAMSEVGEGESTASVEAELKKADEGPGFNGLVVVVAMTTVLLIRLRGRSARYGEP